MYFETACNLQQVMRYFSPSDSCFKRPRLIFQKRFLCTCGTETWGGGLRHPNFLLGERQGPYLPCSVAYDDSDRDVDDDDARTAYSAVRLAELETKFVRTGDPMGSYVKVVLLISFQVPASLFGLVLSHAVTYVF